MKTEFNSFEEIDQQLKILDLQRSIHRESLMFHSRKIKQALLPKNWFKTFDNVIYGAVFSWTLKKLLGNRKKLKA